MIHACGVMAQSTLWQQSLRTLLKAEKKEDVEEEQEEWSQGQNRKDSVCPQLYQSSTGRCSHQADAQYICYSGIIWHHQETEINQPVCRDVTYELNTNAGQKVEARL